MSFYFYFGSEQEPTYLQLIIISEAYMEEVILDNIKDKSFFFYTVSSRLNKDIGTFGFRKPYYDIIILKIRS